MDDLNFTYKKISDKCKQCGSREQTNEDSPDGKFYCVACDANKLYMDKDLAEDARKDAISRIADALSSIEGASESLYYPLSHDVTLYAFSADYTKLSKRLNDIDNVIIKAGKDLLSTLNDMRTEVRYDTKTDNQD